jgi:hypothetical protein
MCERRPGLPTPSINNEDRFRFFRRAHIRHSDLSFNAIPCRVSERRNRRFVMDHGSNVHARMRADVSRNALVIAR